ncbi:MAG: glycosyltransferase family 4 protein, partial [Abitibacteriaceae bacterium]|nr:glycosyltransferase family 4 protein [Abditibacteriaceae bacterium]
IHAGWASHPAFIAWGTAQEAGLPWSFSGHARDLFVEGASLKEKLQAAQFTAVCTRVGQQFLQKEAPQFAAKVLYVPHGLDMAHYHFQVPALDNEMRLLSVGRLVEKKGFRVLLDALSVLQWQGHQFQTTIIGDGPLQQELVARKNVLGLAEQVTFTGAQTQAEVRAAMAQANCFVLPAIIAHDGDRDGLPNVLLEAAASGLPLVSTNTGGITDFLDASTGRLCPAGNAEALAATLLQVFQDKAETLNMCQAARQRVEEQFDIGRNVEQLAKAFSARP